MISSALEPMLLAVTIYMSFCYGVAYLLFEAYPFVFIKNHGFNSGEEGLAFLGFFGGGCIAVIWYVPPPPHSRTFQADEVELVS